MMKSVIFLSLLSALLYGLSGPAMLKAKQTGASITIIALIYGVVATLLAYKYSGKTEPLWTSWKGLLFGITAGIVLGSAFWASGRAISLPDCNISVVSVIIAAYPLITVMIGLFLMGEAEKVNVAKVLIGSGLMVAGLILVSTATKTPQ